MGEKDKNGSTSPLVFNRSALAGAGAGLVTSIAGCPLDVIKTKLQAQEFAHGAIGYKGVWQTTRYVYSKKGIRGFYRGLGPTILGYLPTWAIYFMVYDSVKEYFGESALGATKRLVVDPVAHDPPLDKRQSTVLHIASAMTAGAASTIVTSPLWVVKTRVMAQPLHETPYRHTLDCVLTIYRSEGPRAFYRGLLTSLLGISHVAVQFPLYEQLKEWADQRNPGPLPYSTILLCSATAKMSSEPDFKCKNDHYTTHLYRGPINPEVHYRGILQTTARIVHEETFRGLYKGLSINLFRTVPSSAVTMLTYEALMRYMA